MWIFIQNSKYSGLLEMCWASIFKFFENNYKTNPVQRLTMFALMNRREYWLLIFSCFPANTHEYRGLKKVPLRPSPGTLVSC